MVASRFQEPGSLDILAARSHRVSSQLTDGRCAATPKDGNAQHDHQCQHRPGVFRLRSPMKVTIELSVSQRPGRRVHLVMAIEVSQVTGGRCQEQARSRWVRETA
jgi:hypothetical protein